MTSGFMIGLRCGGRLKNFGNKKIALKKGKLMTNYKWKRVVDSHGRITWKIYEIH